ncbi:DNA repair protein RecN [Pelagibius litoralis]|uniref:DNA repair protein RecN n=1 Tax=Pelagibius litoralis TaxID=374515 RepID=A0A967C4Q3_9PROT|nr:DNA repair protein RecN [Pelagibius litoralis]NIA68634.1 DNA repair protein RecN [Pelagibius litoralis]
MLVSLSIRNIVLIEKLDLTFDQGLGVLTGETGAGKSILLDSLGFALGHRADARLLRPGAEQAGVTATFDVGSGHPAWAVLQEQDFEIEDQLLILRRILTKDGRSRAYVNDQPAAVALLRRLADSLIEIQGQFDQRGLMDPATHRGLLDAYGKLENKATGVAGLWRRWREAAAAREAAAQRLAEAQRDEAYLRHAVEELTTLDPQPGEEAALTEKRNRLMHRGKLIEGVNAANREIEDEERGAAAGLGRSQRALQRIAETAGEALAPAIEAVERALLECEEAQAQLSAFARDMEMEADGLEAVEDRYFALQDMARKHHRGVEDLTALRDELAARLGAIDGGEAELSALARETAEARRNYMAAAETLSEARRKAARKLDKAVAAELPPLKLERAVFATGIERLEEPDWSAQGLDRIAFEVATNPGSKAGPLGKIASGGELARFLLSLKVVLASINPERSLVFDEVDSGVGGATAHAVGERLERLARDRQILVVTHSPQVAARGAQHWQVQKEPKGKQVATQVHHLDAGDRREEIARMLSGAEITDEARAAAERLIGPA